MQILPSFNVKGDSPRSRFEDSPVHLLNSPMYHLKPEHNLFNSDSMKPRPNRYLQVYGK
jgi:hypothetical protein